MAFRTLLGLIVLTTLQIVAASNANSDKFQEIDTELNTIRSLLQLLMDGHEKTNNNLQNVKSQFETKIEQLEENWKLLENRTVEVVEIYKLDADKKYQNFLEKVKNSTCSCNNSTTLLIVEEIEAENRIPTVTTLPTILPIAMYLTSAVYDEKDSIYILGGYSSSGTLDDILQFNISSEKIERVAKLPIKVYHGTSIWDGEGMVYFGGWIGFYASNQILRYIPGMKEAVEVGQLPFGNSASATISHKPGEALIFGGESLNNKIVHYKRNGSVANNMPGQSLPKKVYYAPAVYYSNAETESVFLFGGNDCSKDIIKYNVKTGQSVILNETLPSGLKGSNAFLVGKYIYVFEGSSTKWCKDVSLSDNVVRFNPENNHMEILVLNGFPSSLSYFSAVYIKSLKRAYIFGGLDDSNNYRNQILKLQF